MLAHFGGDFLEEDHFHYVVEGDVADAVADVRCQLLRATTFSRESVEKRIYHVFFGASMNISEIVEEGIPVGVGVALEELIDLGVLTTGKFAFKKSEFVLGPCHFRSRVGVLDASDPLVDMSLIEWGKVWLAK